MTEPSKTIEVVTRAVIKSKIDALNLRERDLVRLGHELFKSGGGRRSTGVPDDVRRRHERVKGMLNGVGSLLPELPADDCEDDIQSQLADVRLALGVLNKANLEQQAVEAASWAVEHAPAWRALVRKRILALAVLAEADAACTAFLDAVEYERQQALPCRYHLNSASRDLFEAAVADGLVKASEVKGALHA